MKTVIKNIRAATVGLSNTINRNAGYLIVVAIVIFGLMNLAFAQDNNTLIKNTNHTAEQTKNIANDTKTIIANLEKAVVDLKADNREQTRILCRLILRDNLQLTPQEEKEIERICQEQIDNSSDDEERTPAASQPEATQPEQRQQNPTGNPSPKPTPRPPTPPQAEEPSVLERTLDRVRGLLNGVRDVLN